MTAPSQGTPSPLVDGVRQANERRNRPRLRQHVTATTPITLEEYKRQEAGDAAGA